MAHQEEDPKNLLIVAVGLGSVVTLVALMLALHSYYTNIRDEWQHVRIWNPTNPALTQMRADHDRKLGSYAFVKADKTQARMPINEAMKQLAQRGRDAFPAIQLASSAAPAGSAPPAGSAVAPATSGSAAPANEPPKDEKKKDEKKDEKKKDEKKKDSKDRP